MKTWTQTENLQLIQLRHAGKTNAEAAVILHRNKGQVRSQFSRIVTGKLKVYAESGNQVNPEWVKTGVPGPNFAPPYTTLSDMPFADVVQKCCEPFPTDDITRSYSAPAAPIEDDKNRVAYWRKRAGELERDLSKALVEKTAVDVLCEQAHELAPKSYQPVPFNPESIQRKSPGGSPQSAVLLFSDTHIGSVVKPEQTLDLGNYNFEIFLRRLKRLERSVFSIVQDHTTTPISELVVPILGDMLDGALVHSAEAGQANTMLSQFYAGGHAIAQFLRNLSVLAPMRIYGCVGNHCVDADTEILTQRGWLKHSELSEHDNCLGLLPSGTAQWQPVLEIVREKQVDKMVSIHNRQFSFRGTEHHRFYYKIPGHPMLNEARWSEIKSLPILIPTAGMREGSGRDVPDALIELCGAVLTDGCLSQGVIVYQHPDNSEWVKEAFDKSGLAYSIRNPPAEICGRPWKGGEFSEERSFRLSSSAGRDFLLRTGIEKGKLPSWVWNFSHAQFERFIQALLDGDGTGARETSPCLFGKSKEFLGEVQALCALHGWTASLSSYQPNNTNLNVQWRLNLIRNSSYVSLGENANIETHEATGELVWCVRTSSENFLCRREGKCYFTGNTRWQNQHKMPSKNRNSNFDMLLYLYIQALTRDIPTIAWKLDTQPFSTFEVQGFPFYCLHGDNIRGGDKALGIPNHSLGRMVSTTTQLFTRANRETPSYFCLGHLHRPIVLPHAKGEIVVNGAFPGIDGYALGEFFNSSHPSQKFWLMHPKFGKSAAYDLRLDLGDATPHGYQLPEEFICI